MYCRMAPVGLDAVAAAAAVLAARDAVSSETEACLPSSSSSSDAGVSGGGVAKKRRNTAARFPAEMLLDLAGSTSAEVRRMNEDERALVHYKRRLRNRESAKRSRARRQATIHDIQVEVEALRHDTASLLDKCVAFAQIIHRQSLELDTVKKEKMLLEAMLRAAAAPTAHRDE